MKIWNRTMRTQLYSITMLPHSQSSDMTADVCVCDVTAVHSTAAAAAASVAATRQPGSVQQRASDDLQNCHNGTTTMSTTNGIPRTNHSLTLMSYNLHGLNQGRPLVQEFMNTVDIFMLQEHSQTPANMSKFSRLFPILIVLLVFLH